MIVCGKERLIKAYTKDDDDNDDDDVGLFYKFVTKMQDNMIWAYCTCHQDAG
jgi:hypothetical protein